MYLKKLTLAGFKSFADPVEFQFHPGTTAIVGPNGCGKSNVVDAFRWVLGERSAKELRGAEMLDVIFKGTSRREALSRAEVSLTFDNEDGALPIEFSEVEVSRRLFRSGESEYLINGTRCRLKDIHALFADTGIGTEGYSVMEQGNLDAFLNSSPQERRRIFEEAAGVSRFKRQKEQALRRLDRADHDLARSRDLLGEVESRIRSLKIQATKARRYVEDRDRLLHVRAVLATEEVGALRAERERITFELFWTQLRRERLARIDEGTERSREEARAAADAAEGELTRLRGEEMGIRVELEGIASRLASAAERRREGEEAARRGAEQAEELRRLAEQYEEQRSLVRAQIRASIGTLRESRRLSAAAATRHRELETRRRGLEGEIHAAKERALSHVYKETQLSNDRAALESERRSLEILRARRRAEAEEFAATVAELARGGASLAAGRDEAAERALSARSESEMLSVEVAARTALLDENRARLAALRGELEERQGRLRFLEELETRREGIGEGARRLLGSRSPVGRDVLGLLAGALEVAPELARAVDAALGSHGETVLLGGEIAIDDRIRAIRREVEEGEIAFVQVEGIAAPIEAPGALPEGCTRLIDHLGIEPRLGRAVFALLEGVYLCADLRAAERARALPGCRLCVLGDGTVVEAWGAVRLPARGGHGLVSRRVEIRGLVARVEALETELAEARAHGDALEETIQARVVDQRRRQEAAQRLELDVEHAERLLRENETERARLDERREVVEAELAELAAQDRGLEGELGEKLARLAEIAAERVGLEERLGALEAERSPLEALLADVERENSRLRVETTQTEERLVAQRREQMRVQSELEERRDRRRRLEEDAVRARERLERLAADEARDRERLAELESALGGLSGRVAEAGAGSAAAKERLQEAERLRSRLRREENELRERREGALLADNERRVRIEGIREKLASELEVESVSALPIETWRAELAADLGEEGLLERLRREQEQIADRLKKNANVNLQAVEELGGEEGRRDHIATQLADLEQSRTTLLETIETLNVRSRDLFLTTFEAVRGHFQEIFATVFNGGTADLLLEQGVDPLEAGVEVQARPPGKKITTLRALSGGEKALTAVSVLFALFRTKPSPFCILDEVDAPLDESNTRRFVRVLSRFANQSQFLIITHSRVTMGEAERLYGVTMEEEGVSKRVAVRVEREEGEEAVRDATIHADALLPPPAIARSDEAQEAPALTG